MPIFKTANCFDQGLTIQLQFQSTSRAATSQVPLSKPSPTPQATLNWRCSTQEKNKTNQNQPT